MAIKKSELYNSLWKSCDELCGLYVAKTKSDREISEIAPLPFSSVKPLCFCKMIGCFRSFLAFFIGSARFFACGMTSVSSSRPSVNNWAC